MKTNQDKIIKDINKSLIIITTFSLLSSALFLLAYFKLHLEILLIAVIVLVCMLPIIYYLGIRMKTKYMIAKDKAEQMNIIKNNS